MPEINIEESDDSIIEETFEAWETETPLHHTVSPAESNLTKGIILLEEFPVAM